MVKIKKQNHDESLNDISENKVHIKKVDTNGMTYKEYASQELNNKLNPLLEKRIKIGNAIQKALAEFKETKRTARKDQIAEIIKGLRDKKNTVEKEINDVSHKHVVDFDLMQLAIKIDDADQENKANDLLYSIGSKINEIISMIREVKECYEFEYYAPTAYWAIKNSIIGLVGTLNNELPKLHKKDKQELIQQFNKKIAIIEEHKREIQADKDKYNIE